MLLITDKFELSEVQFMYSDVPRIEEINPMMLWDILKSELESNSLSLPAIQVKAENLDMVVDCIEENYKYVSNVQDPGGLTLSKSNIRSWAKTKVEPLNRYSINKILYFVKVEGSAYGRWLLIDLNHTYKQKER